MKPAPRGGRLHLMRKHLINFFALKSSRAAGQLIVISGQAAMRHEETVAQMVAERPARARVFEKWGLSYCCGQHTVAQACREQDVDAEAVLSDLRACDARTDALPSEEAFDWSHASLSEQIEAIVQGPHQFLRDEIPRLSYLVDRVADDHGAAFSEFWEMQGLFEDLKEQIESHITREETALFPVLKCLETSGADATESKRDLSYSISLLRSICHQHSENIMLRASLKMLRGWINHFQPPSGVCNTYRVLAHDLGELETAIARHLSIEEDVIFPRALSLAASEESA